TVSLLSRFSQPPLAILSPSVTSLYPYPHLPAGHPFVREALPCVLGGSRQERPSWTDDPGERPCEDVREALPRVLGGICLECPRVDDDSQDSSQYQDRASILKTTLQGSSQEHDITAWCWTGIKSSRDFFMAALQVRVKNLLRRHWAGTGT
ncbi:hypothetical protein FIBSPDRAFT_846796, partial [Athelia psychrophila]